MTTVPGPLYVPSDRWPVLTFLTLAVLAAGVVMALAGAVPAELAATALVAWVLVGAVAAPLETAGGHLVLVLALVLSAGAGYAVPLALDGDPPATGLWVLYGGIGCLGLGLGCFQTLAPRPLCFLKGGLGSLAMHWSGLFVLWLMAEAMIGWRYGLPVLVHSIVVFALGVLSGLVIRALGVIRLARGGSPEQMRKGINRAQALIDAHKLKSARRHIDALLAVAPEDLAVRRMRYAAWKFEPRSPAFHRAAADLLARRERDGGDQADITALYKDYLAVTQGRPELPSDLHIELARRFANWGDTENAASIVNLYLQRETSHPMLPDAVLGLADAYVRNERFSRAEYFADTLITMIPNSGEAQMAQRLLRKIRERKAGS